jgi:cobalt transport protein
MAEGKSKTIYIVGFAIIAIMVIAILAYGAANGFELGGSDDAGGEKIAEITGEIALDDDGNPIIQFEDEGTLMHDADGTPYMRYEACRDDDGNIEYVHEHKTWWNGIFGDYELPGETESMLFALQAAIGAVLIGFFIGWYTRKD